MKILFIDNYDSFTYNLVHYFEGFEVEIDVFRNDEIPFEQLDQYQGVVLSPGPGLPQEAGDQNKLIKEIAGNIPTLGVCLGFQALIEFYGGKLFNQEQVQHGVSVAATFDHSSKLFKNIPEKFKVGLYHSWGADKDHFPKELKITGITESGVVMAFEHISLPVFGVQFHPESILTEHGHKIVENFICSLA